jgi:hypothetical protein
MDWFKNAVIDAIHKPKYGRNISVGLHLCSFMADFALPDLDI